MTAQTSDNFAEVVKRLNVPDFIKDALIKEHPPAGFVLWIMQHDIAAAIRDGYASPHPALGESWKIMLAAAINP